MKKLLASIALTGALVSSSLSASAPYALSPLENYLIESFAWEQYEGFLNTGSSTLFENPKVSYLTVGGLLKACSTDPKKFIKNFKGQHILLNGLVSNVLNSGELLQIKKTTSGFTVDIHLSTPSEIEIHPGKKYTFYCRVANASKNSITLDSCMSGQRYEKIKTAEIETGIKNFLASKDQSNPNMPTYAMLAYMALVSARILPENSVCRETLEGENNRTDADVRSCNREVAQLWENASQIKGFDEAMDSVERDLSRHGADLDMIRKAATLMD